MRRFSDNKMKNNFFYKSLLFFIDLDIYIKTLLFKK